MRIDRARLRDTPALAWVAAQAFAAESSNTGIHRRARHLYLMHLYSLALLACGGRLWHWDKKAIIVIEHKKRRPAWKIIAAIGLCIAVVMGLLAWIRVADGHGLQILLAIMRAGGAFLVIVLVLLLPAIVPALKEMHPQRAARNADAIQQWKRTRPGHQFYKISYLAMYPQTMEGLSFATTAIERVVPAGAALYTEARSDNHKTIYARRGFRPLATADGTPTLAMGSSRARPGLQSPK